MTDHRIDVLSEDSNIVRQKERSPYEQCGTLSRIVTSLSEKSVCMKAK